MKLLLPILLFTNLLFSQTWVGSDFKKLSVESDSLDILQAIELEKKGAFNGSFKNKIYQNLQHKKAVWVVSNIPKLKEDYYIAIENPLFDLLELYIIKNNSIHYTEYEKEEYRFPLILVSKEQTPCKLFIKAKDSISYRTEFSIKSFNVVQFKKKIEKDYFILGAYTIGIIVLLICAAIIFMYKREFVIIWYIIHLNALILEYLIGNGILGQWFSSNQFLHKYSIDNIFILISVMSLAEFFRNYYKYNQKTLFCKKIYVGISLFCLFGLFTSLYNLLTGVNYFNVEHIAHLALNYGSLTSLLIQCVLVYHKVIPKYLFIAFFLPTLGIFANLGGFKDLFKNPDIIYFIYQSVYLGVFINVMVIIFYISKQSIDGELLSINLKKENNLLKDNFQENLSKIQEEHQNILMSDVHDSFGGYIEALRLNLLQKDLNSEKINEILKAFKKDYKFLLNTLYVPNINSDNFELAIEEYCTKMNELSSMDIKFVSSIDKNSKLSQPIAKLLFKATSELTTNAIKYSEGSYINIDLIIRNQNIFLTVSDNGVGFNLKNIPKTSFGIKGIKARLALINGTFEIQNKKGTNAVIYIPLDSQDI